MHRRADGETFSASLTVAQRARFPMGIVGFGTLSLAAIQSGHAGFALTTGSLAAGTQRFMCLIHPWMRTTVTVG